MGSMPILFRATRNLGWSVDLGLVAPILASSATTLAASCCDFHHRSQSVAEDSVLGLLDSLDLLVTSTLSKHCWVRSRSKKRCIFAFSKYRVTGIHPFKGWSDAAGGTRITRTDVPLASCQVQSEGQDKDQGEKTTKIPLVRKPVPNFNMGEPCNVVALQLPIQLNY